MDSRKLPGRALVDSGIVTRAMGDLAPDDATEVCKGFYEAMLAFGREIYDALIVACGIRHGAECVVTLDLDIVRLCAAVGFGCRNPSDFLTRATLALPDPTANPIPE